LQLGRVFRCCFATQKRAALHEFGHELDGFLPIGVQ
jgi:hypothetical protein